MNGPPIVLMLLIIAVAVYFGGRAWDRARIQQDMRGLDRAEDQRRRAREEWERRQHPSGR